MFNLRKYISHIKDRKRVALFFTFMLVCGGCFAQLEPLSTQHMNNQIMFNPAYTGIRNSLSANLHARNQWLGLNGAPTNYVMSVHSPINNSMASLGGSLSNYSAGLIKDTKFSAYYSYLVRLNHNTFVSFGTNASLSNYRFDRNEMNLIEEDDPNFKSKIGNTFNPNIGAGVFLYSQKYYLGFSIPALISTKYKSDDENAIVVAEKYRTIYATGSYGISLGQDFYLKPSFLYRINSAGFNSFDITSQVFYKDYFWAGISYRFDTSISILYNQSIGESLNICYSYDYPIISKPGISKGTHEITLLIDSYQWIKRNRNRVFQRKKKQELDGIESIRYF